MEWRNSWDIWHWTRQNDLIHWADQLDWFEKQRTDPTISMYGITADTGSKTEYRELVGVTGLTDINHYHKRAEFSLYIAPEHQKKGYGKVALWVFLWLSLESHRNS